MTTTHAIIYAFFLASFPAFGQSDGSLRSAARVDVNADGFRLHQLSSEFQAGETNVRVLLPDRFDATSKYRTLYVLPVVAGAPGKHGNGLNEIKKQDLHNKHDLICVAPEFTALPWYANHDSDSTRRDESYFLRDVIPMIEKTYPVIPEAEGRLLVGFSKSGWGSIFTFA